MAIVDVTDIKILKANSWYSLKNGNIYANGKKNILPGAAAVYGNGNWYRLKQDISTPQYFRIDQLSIKAFIAFEPIPANSSATVQIGSQHTGFTGFSGAMPEANLHPIIVDLLHDSQVAFSAWLDFPSATWVVLNDKNDNQLAIFQHSAIVNIDTNTLISLVETESGTTKLYLNIIFQN